MVKKTPNIETVIDGSRYEAFAIDYEDLEQFLADCRRDMDNIELGEAPEIFAHRWRKKLDDMLLPPKEGRPPRRNHFSIWCQYKEWIKEEKKRKRPYGDRQFTRRHMGAKTEKEIRSALELLRDLKEKGESNIVMQAVKWRKPRLASCRHLIPDSFLP